VFPSTTSPAVAILNAIRFQQCHTAVLWDKDSTLANTEHRHWMIPEIISVDPSYTWTDYAMRCERDVPVDAARDLMQMLAPNHLQIVASGAHMAAMVPIGSWLMRNNFPVDMVRLRPEDDEVDGGLLKVRQIFELEKEHGIKTVLFVEDNPSQSKIIEEMTGVPVLTVNPRWSPRSRELAAQTSGSI
jgi:hypothetical protein